VVEAIGDLLKTTALTSVDAARTSTGGTIQARVREVDPALLKKAMQKRKRYPTRNFGQTDNQATSRLENEKLFTTR
jgi:hypothetical protein